MDSISTFQCALCSQIMDTSEELGPFVKVSCCSQCRPSASASEMNFQQGLTILFERSMTLGLPSPVANDKSRCSVSVPPHSTALYSITQHYHHSAHIARPKESASNMEMHPVAIDTLRQHNVDPSTLSLSQCELYDQAMPEQRSRLSQMRQSSLEHQCNIVRGDTQGSKIQNSDGINEATNIPDFWDISFENGTTENFDTLMSDQGVDQFAGQYAEPYMIIGYGAIAQVARESPERRDVDPPREPSTGAPYKLANDPVYRSQGQRWWECRFGMVEHIDR
ncbi:uncharacterized protein BP01DRAFT_361173 [Aspergillus saccharolyticus JOP 1030-1]|uniref:Uncharacterized protein n=1 Tax=Aspergillus saccharolyticus JOP 1030-1 TaxID=1450539 RepID=A0A318ZAK8_9EURO|nr:hypothetical protein BP01DRAFT_361173 [Aspergillus saccharolyticus JOP 1030-1]PYH40520.1 hypothetical protein BP01DRAFT_361173 [Aspergillus saccharolyticus JOP 1030-1]